MIKDVHSAGVALAKEADERRSELERERRVPADLFQRAAVAGLFRQLICTELGGIGRSAIEWFRTGVEMARWEPSFSWVVTQGAGDSATFASAGDPAFVSAYLADHLKSFGRRRRTKVVDERTRGEQVPLYGEFDF